MKKRQIGSIEILGWVGMLLWGLVTILRGCDIQGGAAYQRFLDNGPNVGAAWAMTLVGKILWMLISKRRYTVAGHLSWCAGIAVLALASEVFHDLFLNAPFDGNDMLVTVLAQMVMIWVPMMVKDKCFMQEREAGERI